jgi:hypothetical protein
MNKSLSIETQTTKIDFIKSGVTLTPENDSEDQKYSRRHTKLVTAEEIQEELKSDVIGLSHLLSNHYAEKERKRKSKKNKKKRLPKITTTIKSFGAMIGEMIQAKYIADCTDHAAGQKPQSFPDFLQQYFQLKFGKQHARGVSYLFF